MSIAIGSLMAGLIGFVLAWILRGYRTRIAEASANALFKASSKLGEQWTQVGERLGQAVEAYNRSTGTLESRVMASARRFREFKVGPEDAEIAPAPPIGVIPRMIQAEELMPKQLAGGSGIANRFI